MRDGLLWLIGAGYIARNLENHGYNLQAKGELFLANTLRTLRITAAREIECRG